MATTRSWQFGTNDASGTNRPWGEHSYLNNGTSVLVSMKPLPLTAGTRTITSVSARITAGYSPGLTIDRTILMVVKDAGSGNYEVEAFTSFTDHDGVGGGTGWLTWTPGTALSFTIPDPAIDSAQRYVVLGFEEDGTSAEVWGRRVDANTGEQLGRIVAGLDADPVGDTFAFDSSSNVNQHFTFLWKIAYNSDRRIEADLGAHSDSAISLTGNISVTSSVATATETGHSRLVGDRVVISGITAGSPDHTGLNGEQVITAVRTNEWDFDATGEANGTSTGTIVGLGVTTHQLPWIPGSQVYTSIVFEKLKMVDGDALDIHLVEFRDADLIRNESIEFDAGDTVAGQDWILVTGTQSASVQLPQVDGNRQTYGSSKSAEFDLAIQTQNNTSLRYDVIWQNRSYGAGDNTLAASDYRDIVTISHAADGGSHGDKHTMADECEGIQLIGPVEVDNIYVCAPEGLLVGLGDSQCGVMGADATSPSGFTASAHRMIRHAEIHASNPWYLWVGGIGGGFLGLDSAGAGHTAVINRYKNSTVGLGDVTAFRGVVIALCGPGVNDVNNASEGQPVSRAEAETYADTMKSHYETVIDDAQTNGNAVLILGLPPYEGAANQYRAYGIRRLDRVLYDLAVEKSCAGVGFFHRALDGSPNAGSHKFRVDLQDSDDVHWRKTDTNNNLQHLAELVETALDETDQLWLFDTDVFGRSRRSTGRYIRPIPGRLFGALT